MLTDMYITIPYHLIISGNINYFFCDGPKNIKLVRHFLKNKVCTYIYPFLKKSGLYTVTARDISRGIRTFKEPKVLSFERMSDRWGEN